VKTDKGSLIVKTFVSSMNEANAYLLISGHEAAVIDGDDAYHDIATVLDEQELALKYLLVTHGHKSHVQAVPMLKESFGGSICMHQSDTELLRESGIPFEPDMPLKDRASLPLDDCVIQVLHTPGHTPPS